MATSESHVWHHLGMCHSLENFSKVQELKVHALWYAMLLSAVCHQVSQALERNKFWCVCNSFLKRMLLIKQKCQDLK